MKKSNIHTLVISDLHLGTIHNNSQLLWEFLKTVDPENLILVGDVIDLWHKINFSEYELKVIKKIIKWASEGKKVTWLIGNHDEQLRVLVGEDVANIEFCNEKVLDMGPHRVLFIHGDKFDVFIQSKMKFLSKLGSVGYALLLRLNKIYKFIHRGAKESLAQKIKRKVKNAASFLSEFENCVVTYGHQKGCSVVICGHVHTAKVEDFKGQLKYINCGDWQESSDYVIFDGKELKLFQYAK